MTIYRDGLQEAQSTGEIEADVSTSSGEHARKSHSWDEFV